MAIKIYKQGNFAIIDYGTEALPIRLDQFQFNLDSTNASAWDASNPDVKHTDALGNIQDKSGNAIGGYDDVRDYFADFFLDNVVETETAAGSASLDAFGRLRTSELTTLLDIKQIFDKQPLLIDEETNGTGARTYVSADACCTLSTAASGDWVVAQTFQRMNYQTGKSQFGFMTFNGFDIETNITKRIGYFDSSTTSPYTADLDGLWLESSGSEVSVNIGKSGTVTSVDQSDWDDPLDGSGESGITIDWDKGQIFAFDFEWLGVGAIRFYVVIDGMPIVFHKENNANNLTDVYMQSPNKPLRWEIRQGGAGSGDFKHICATVSSEGARNFTGKILSDNSSGNDLQFNSVGTSYAAVGIRQKSGFLGAVLDILEFDYLAETSDRAFWELRLNPTVTGTFAYTGITSSSAETAIGNQTGGAAPTTSGGTLLASGYLQGEGYLRQSIESAIKIGSAIDGTRDEIVLCITPIQNNLDAFVSFTWRENV